MNLTPTMFGALVIGSFSVGPAVIMAEERKAKFYQELDRERQERAAATTYESAGQQEGRDQQ